MEKKVYTYPTSGDRCASNGSVVYIYHYDHIGNVLMITNAAGAKVYNFEQDAFGNELTLPSTPFAGSAWATARSAGITEHQTGKWSDPLTGLYYFAARWYDPLTGRFVGRDPDPGSILTGESVYTFVRNRPSVDLDPTGEDIYLKTGNNSGKPVNDAYHQ